MSKMDSKIPRNVKVHTLQKYGDIRSFIEHIIGFHKQTEAFYVLNKSDIVKKHKIWEQALPQVIPHYAVKCNDSIAVLETLAALGVGFDCASKNEISKVLSLGVDPSRIIFANPVKPTKHIIYAAEVGVDVMTFDNQCELEKIKEIHPNAKLIIRIKCDAEDAQLLFGKKFGCDPLTEAPKLLKTAKYLNLDVIGVSFHVGTGCKELKAYSRAITAARSIFNLASDFGFVFRILDIGGGYSGSYDGFFERTAECVNEALEENFQGLPNVHFIAEPGRYYVQTAYTLVCKIHSTRDINIFNNDTRSEEFHRMYYIDDGVYGSFNSKVSCNEVYIPQALNCTSGQKTLLCSIWGPTCDSVDRVVETAILPEMRLGDWIMFEEMGAYTLSIATDFNGFPVPEVYVITDEFIEKLLQCKSSVNKKYSEQQLHWDSKSSKWFMDVIRPFTRACVAIINSFKML